jgi:Tfp pilus assembly protein FimV
MLDSLSTPRCCLNDDIECWTASPPHVVYPRSDGLTGHTQESTRAGSVCRLPEQQSMIVDGDQKQHNAKRTDRATFRGTQRHVVNKYPYTKRDMTNSPAVGTPHTRPDDEVEGVAQHPDKPVEEDDVREETKDTNKQLQHQSQTLKRTLKTAQNNNALPDARGVG